MWGERSVELHFQNVLRNLISGRRRRLQFRHRLSSPGCSYGCSVCWRLPRGHFVYTACRRIMETLTIPSLSLSLSVSFSISLQSALIRPEPTAENAAGASVSLRLWHTVRKGTQIACPSPQRWILIGFFFFFFSDEETPYLWFIGSFFFWTLTEVWSRGRLFSSWTVVWTELELILDWITIEGRHWSIMAFKTPPQWPNG